MLKTVSIAGIEEQGVPFKKESFNLEEAAKTISLGYLTWIEVVVDDIVAETPQILERLGITMEASTLLSGYITEYEDTGDTLGIMVPFIFSGESRTQTSPCLIFSTLSSNLSLISILTFLYCSINVKRLSFLELSFKID